MGKRKMSYYCLFLCRLRWQTILSHCFVATSSLRANCLVAMRTSAVSLFPHERNPGMQRCPIQKTECAESEQRNARLETELRSVSRNASLARTAPSVEMSQVG